MDDIEAIKQLKARYFRTLDTKDWIGFREVFTPDAHIDFTGESGVYEGADEFVAVVEPGLRDVVTIHHGHMPEIEITSPDTATGIWAMEDRLRYPPGRKVAEVHGYGFYHETYHKTDGAWRIQSLRLVRLARRNEARAGWLGGSLAGRRHPAGITRKRSEAVLERRPRRGRLAQDPRTRHRGDRRLLPRRRPRARIVMRDPHRHPGSRAPACLSRAA